MGRTHIEKPWTVADFETLQTRWASGASASVIGNEIGRSRSSVCGKVSREKLTTKDRPRPPPSIRQRKTTLLLTRKTPRPSPPFVPTLIATVAMHDVPNPPDAKPVGLMDRRSFHCRAVLDNERDDRGLKMYCGGHRAIVDGRLSSYCLHHHLAYVNPRRV